MNDYDPFNLLVSRGFEPLGRSGYVSRFRRTEADGRDREVWVSWTNPDAWVYDFRGRDRYTVAALEGTLRTAKGREEVTAYLATI